MADNSNRKSQGHEAPLAGHDDLHLEVERLNGELRAFVAVALKHSMRAYCETRHPELMKELETGIAQSLQQSRVKYQQVLAGIQIVQDLRGSCGETGERTYYRNDNDNVAYVEHKLGNKRFVLSGIWVAPQYRGKGIAHDLLRKLVETADAANLGIELYHEPFG